MNKRLLSFLLVFSLLILPVSRAYAWSWSDWQGVVQAPINFISQSIDKDVAKKLFPVVILATLAALYFFIGKKNVEKQSESSLRVMIPGVFFKEKSDIFLSHLSHPIMQYDVYNQFEEGGGDSASCGYHALLRALQLVQGKSNGDGEDKIKKTLLDPTDIKTYFVKDKEIEKCGEWRREVINKGVFEKLKEKLHTQLIETSLVLLTEDALSKFLPSLKMSDPKEYENATEAVVKRRIESLRLSILGNIEDLVVTLMVKNSFNDDYFKDDDIITKIQQGFDSVTRAVNNPFVEFLKDPGVISTYLFDIGAMKNVLAMNNILSIKNKSIEEVESPSNYKAYGEWIDHVELGYLWKYENEKQNSIIKNKNTMCFFGAISDISLVGDWDEVRDEGNEGATKVVLRSDVVPDLKGFMKEKLKNKQECFGIIALRTGVQDRKVEMMGNLGHWYPLVIHQDNAGMMNYYIMDSMGSDRTNDSSARKIMDLIDQKSPYWKQ